MKHQTQAQGVVFVIDDDEAVRDALKRLLGSVGLQAETYASASEFLHSKRPDISSCLVLDVRLPGLSGLDFQSEVEFLIKPFREQDLLDAVQIALERDRARRESEKTTSSVRARFDSLTPREQEVIAFVASGLMNKQIAAEIGVSEVTVKVHRGNVMRKMGAKSLADLIRMADVLGIYRPRR
jgi:FixJ family two-component response regulator